MSAGSKYADKHCCSDEMFEVTVKLIETAWSAENRGDLAEAIKKSTEALKICPNEWYLNSCKGLFLRMNGELQEAERFCRRAVDLGPEQLKAWENLALVCFFDGRCDEAVEYFSKAIEIEEQAHILTLLASARLELQDIKGAIKNSRRALELDPNWGEADDVLKQALKMQDE